MNETQAGSPKVCFSRDSYPVNRRAVRFSIVKEAAKSPVSSWPGLVFRMPAENRVWIGKRRVARYLCPVDRLDINGGVMMMRWLGLGFATAIAVLGASFGTAGAAGVGETCGGTAKIACDAGLWCDPSPKACNASNASGRCVRLGTFCDAMFLPVCGCDGKTYGNDCERMHAKVAKDRDGACK